MMNPGLEITATARWRISFADAVRITTLPSSRYDFVRRYSIVRNVHKVEIVQHVRA
jgi:hypothetical protein